MPSSRRRVILGFFFFFFLLLCACGFAFRWVRFFGYTRDGYSAPSVPELSELALCYVMLCYALQ